MIRLIKIFLFLICSISGFTQSVDGAFKTLTASGTDTYTINEPTPSTYNNKERFLVRFSNANTGAATLNRSALGAKDIKKHDGSALSAGDIQAGGTYLLSYNGTYYQIVGDGGGGGGSFTLSNGSGTTASGSSVHFGGTLTGSATIAGNGFPIRLGTPASKLDTLKSYSSYWNYTYVGNSAMSFRDSITNTARYTSFKDHGTQEVIRERFEPTYYTFTVGDDSFINNQSEVQATDDNYSVDVLNFTTNEHSTLSLGVTQAQMRLETNGGVDVSLIRVDPTLVNISQQGVDGTAQLDVATNAISVSSTDAAFAGVQEGADYSSNYTDASLTRKSYVDDADDLKANELATYNTQAGSYTLVLTDKDTKTVEMNSGSANNLTVPLNSSVAFPIGTTITIVQKGAGLTSVVATGGVTINTSSGSLNSPGQNAPMVLQKRATDEWYLWNGTSASVPSHTLDSHSNVTITANSSGEILKWNGSAWINNTLAEAGIQPAGTYASGPGSASGTNTGDQTIANTSDATSHTVTLSASGGSVQLVEGSNITLTTTGTSGAGVVTISSTGGGGGLTFQQVLTLTY